MFEKILSICSATIMRFITHTFEDGLHCISSHTFDFLKNPLYHQDMPTLTIPKELTRAGDLIIVPRKEYDALVHFRISNVREVAMTPAQKRSLIRARKNFAAGKFLTPHELRQKLARQD